MRSGVSSAPKALNLIPTTDKLWTSCLNALRQICGDRAILPTTHVLSRGLIKRGNTSPAIHDADSCWEAQYKRRAVRVRSLQMSPDSDTALIKVPSYYPSVMRCALTSHEEALPRGRTLEETQPPKYCLGLGRDDGPVPSRVRPSIGQGRHTIRSEWRSRSSELGRFHPRSLLIRPPLADVFFQISEIAEGLGYLHSQSVVHGRLRGASHHLLPQRGPQLTASRRGLFLSTMIVELR